MANRRDFCLPTCHLLANWSLLNTSASPTIVIAVNLHQAEGSQPEQHIRLSEGTYKILMVEPYPRHSDVIVLGSSY